jgi:hypothetical protein
MLLFRDGKTVDRTRRIHRKITVTSSNVAVTFRENFTRPTRKEEEIKKKRH